ncbi:MAG: exodeoxyribonuclease V subunit gamma [Ruminococcus sp.]|nr:exodeoxyribonuclease V subunit gamma [Ruminococcus sp.]
MIEFIIGSSGTGKTTEMFERIKKFQAEEKEVCVIVPEQYSNDFDRTLYQAIGAENFNKLVSSTFSGISRELFQLYGDPNRNGDYADENARMIIIYQAIASAGNLKFFAKRKNQNGFAEEILQLITDMKQSGITLENFLKKVELLSGKLGEKASDVSKIYCEYEKLMKEYGFKDNLENIRIASEIANKNEYFKGKSVFFDEFESFNADQLDMIKVIFASAENVVVTLRTDNVHAYDFTLFDTVNSTYKQLVQICTDNNYSSKVKYQIESYRFKSPDLKYISENIMRNKPNKFKNAPLMQNILLFEARDMYSEVEYVCANIKRLIHNSNGKLRYRDIAIISNNIEDYSTILKTAFERYEIPYFLSTERSINHAPIVVFFIVLLDLLTSRKIQSEQIFRLLKCGILDVNITDISLLENYCYKWGVDGDVWTKPFTAEDENLDKINTMRKNIITPIVEIKKKLRGKIAVLESCTYIYNYFVECNAENNLQKIMNNLININRDYEASELKRLWSCIMGILDSIVQTIGENTMTFSELSSIIRSMIGKITYSVPPQTLDSVMTASARTARLNSPKVVFVMGANDGTFPNQISLYGIFSEGDKQKLSEKGINISRSVIELSASERLIVYKALSTASHKLYVTYPLADLKGTVKYSASVVGQIDNMFKETAFDKKYMKKDSHIISEENLPPDFYAVTKKSAYYHYMQENARKDKSVASIEKALFEYTDYKERIESNFRNYRNKKEAKFHVSTGIIEKLRGGFQPLILSPTGIENYNKCHFMYFCKSCLSLNIPEKIDLDVRIAGSLTHECFHSIVQRNDFKTMSEQDLKNEIYAQADKYCEDNLGGDFSKTPRFELFFSKLKEQLFNVFEYTQAALKDSDFEPKEFEYNVNSIKTSDFEFSENSWLKIKGVVDRMDIWENPLDNKKYLRVIDYKSSKKKLNAFNIGNGINLQMLIYMFLATDIAGNCKATDKSGDYSSHIPAGALYCPVSISDVACDNVKETVKNQEKINDALKASGKLLDDVNVIKAMEKSMVGKRTSSFIPVRITTKNEINGQDLSKVIPGENMEKLRKLVYEKMTETAESIKSGDVKAEPVVSNNENPCRYCYFSALCGNGDTSVQRSEEDTKKAEEKAEAILCEKKKGDKKK